MKNFKEKPSRKPKKTTYIVKDVYMEPNPDKRNQKVVRIIKKHMKESKNT